MPAAEVCTCENCVCDANHGRCDTGSGLCLLAVLLHDLLRQVVSDYRSLSLLKLSCSHSRLAGSAARQFFCSGPPGG